MEKSHQEILVRMYAEQEQAPEIYQPSKIWVELLRTKAEKWADFAHFKRDINGNFGNTWVFERSHPSFQRIWNLTPGRHNSEVIELLEPVEVLRNQECASVYLEYVILLNFYVRGKDPYGLFHKLQEPAVGNPIKIRWGEKFVSQDLARNYLDFVSIYSHFPQLKDQSLTLLEVGGGYGCLASIFGWLTQSRCWLVDIPPSLFVAQEYIRRVFPEKRIFEFRHFDSFDEVKDLVEQADFCFFTPNQLELIPPKSVDISLNINGFGDMTPEQVKNYMNIFARISKLGIHSRNEIFIPGQMERFRKFGDKEWACPGLASYYLSNVEIVQHQGFALEPTYTELTYRLCS